MELGDKILDDERLLATLPGDVLRLVGDFTYQNSDAVQPGVSA